MIRASLLAIVLSFAAEAAVAQTGPIELGGIAESAAPRPLPRTPEGRPDFGGNWFTAFITSTGRMDGATKLVASDEEAKELSRKFVDFANSPAAGALVDPDFFVAGVDQLAKVKGEWRTSLITTPASGVQEYTEQGRRLDAQRKQWNQLPAEGPEMRPLMERCVVAIGSAPLTPVPSTIVRQFIQTPDHLVIASDGNDTRIIGFETASRPAAIVAPLGDSTAHWEGDVLVVHTTRLSGEVHKHIITRPESRVIERFEMLGPDELFYRFTVEDTAIYAGPWSAEFVLTRSKERVYEYSCHEHNYSMVNILQAGRVADQKAAKARAAKAPATEKRS
ncbi:MAG TPA: hypothetical protein VIA80_15025 [Hyphomonadaceae bacterium]|jgi:hypothetical protein